MGQVHIIGMYSINIFLPGPAAAPPNLMNPPCPYTFRTVGRHIGLVVMRMIYGNKLPLRRFLFIPFSRAELRACKIGFDEYFPDLIKGWKRNHASQVFIFSVRRYLAVAV